MFLHSHCCLVAKSCQNLCDPMDCSPPGSSVQGFPRKEFWSGLPFPSPGDLSDPEIELMSPAWQADSLPLSHLGSPLTYIVQSLRKERVDIQFRDKEESKSRRHF